ncbi:phosphotransferase [Candidatus Daviesbacteria bacterium]|nr:phosphotransferase [Candidatus Daviesbacteria bacterium]
MVERVAESSSPQPPPIEQRVLLLETHQFREHTFWRRQRFATTTDPREKSRLAHEIQVLTSRAQELQQDQSAPSLEVTRGRLAQVDQQLRALGTQTSPEARLRRTGLQIRRKLLESRSAFLNLTGRVIRTTETHRWKKGRELRAEALPPDQWDRLSPRLRANPEAALDEKQELQWYMSTLSPDRRQDVHALAVQMRPIGDDVRAIVCMPAKQEGQNIFRTLSNYLGQKELDGKPFDYRKVRFVVFDNWPEGSTPDQTGSETRRFIETAKAKHPGLQVDYIKGTIDPKVARIANIRNLLTAAVIENAANNRHRGARDLIYVSNDADIPESGVKPDYVARIIQEFDTHPKMEALAGKIDFPERLMARVPVQFATRRLWQFIDLIMIRKYVKEPFLVGRNSALRLKSVAAVGNYDPADKMGEDVAIGYKIAWMRSWDRARGVYNRASLRRGKHQEGNVIRYVHGVAMDTDPRRDLIQLLRNVRIGNQYSDFEENQEVRGKSGEALAGVLAERGFGTFNRALFEKEAEAFYQTWVARTNWKSTPEIFNRAMSLLGVKYEVRNGKFRLTDTTQLEKNLRLHYFREFHRPRLEQYLKTKLRRIEVMQAGANNMVVGARTSEGKQIIIRLAARPDNRFAVEKTVLDALSAKGLPVPKVVALDSSKQIIPGFFCQVTERLPGAPFVAPAERTIKRPTDQLMSQAGATLRQIHETKLPMRGFGLWKNEKGEGWFDSWESFILRPFTEDVLKSITDRKWVNPEVVKQVVQIVNSRRQLLRGAPQSLLHGDFNLGNLLTANGRMTGIVDFENVSSGDSLWDFAKFMVHESRNITPTSLRALLSGYGKFDLYRLSTIFYDFKWFTSQPNTTPETIAYFNSQLQEVLASISQTRESGEIVRFAPISREQISNLLKTRFDGAVEWFRNFYEKGLGEGDKEFETGRKRYEEIRPQLQAALERGDEASKRNLITLLRADPKVSLSDTILGEQINRLVSLYKQNPALFRRVDPTNPAFKFIVYSRNRGNLSRYEREYALLPKEVNFRAIVDQLVREKTARGQAVKILDEGGTYDLAIQQLAQRIIYENPGAKVQLSSTAADNMAYDFRDCHRYPVRHRMADVHHLNRTFGGEKQTLIVSQAAYKFFWDPFGAIVQTANALERGGWAFLGDIQENVSFKFSNLFLDENGRSLDPVKVFEYLNSLNLGYKFYVKRHEVTGMGDQRDALTLAIRKDTDRNLDAPIFYAQRPKQPTESKWISSIVYVVPKSGNQPPGLLPTRAA